LFKHHSNYKYVYLKAPITGTVISFVTNQNSKQKNRNVRSTDQNIHNKLYNREMLKRSVKSCNKVSFIKSFIHVQLESRVSKDVSLENLQSLYQTLGFRINEVVARKEVHVITLDNKLSIKFAHQLEEQSYFETFLDQINPKAVDQSVVSSVVVLPAPGIHNHKRTIRNDPTHPPIFAVSKLLTESIVTPKTDDSYRSATHVLGPKVKEVVVPCGESHGTHMQSVRELMCSLYGIQLVKQCPDLFHYSTKPQNQDSLYIRVLPSSSCAVVLYVRNLQDYVDQHLVPNGIQWAWIGRNGPLDDDDYDLGGSGSETVVVGRQAGSQRQIQILTPSQCGGLDVRVTESSEVVSFFHERAVPSMDLREEASSSSGAAVSVSASKTPKVEGDCWMEVRVNTKNSVRDMMVRGVYALFQWDYTSGSGSGGGGSYNSSGNSGTGKGGSQPTAGYLLEDGSVALMTNDKHHKESLS
jgi:hypothetical protein